MTVTRSARLAWILCGLICLLALVDLILGIRSLPRLTTFVELLSGLVWSFQPIVFSVVSALITSRQPRNRIGWLLMAPAALFSFSRPIDFYLSSFTTTPPATLPVLLLAWFSNWSWLLLIFPLFLILLLFPTGRPPSPRWHWVLGYTLVMFIIFVTWSGLVKEITETNGAWKLPNPIGLIPDTPEMETLLVTPWIISLAALAVVCAASLFARYRRAPAGERVQIRWLLFAASIFVVCYVPLLVLQGNTQGIADLLLGVSSMLFPIAIAVAILRYRLWDIDVIIRKTLSYALLTALLALVFFASVVLLQQLVGRIAGTQDSPIIIVFSTLAIAALFTPLRRMIQNFIDRRFFRRSYDSQLILERFAAATLSEVEMEQLVGQLTSVVEETLQPESVSMWLVAGKSAKAASAYHPPFSPGSAT